MRSLIEDWLLRREKLKAAEPLQQCALLVRILDYLIARYANDPVAQSSVENLKSSSPTAEAPMPAEPFDQHEFTRDTIAPRLRAREILKRMAELDLQSDTLTHMQEMQRRW